MKTIDVKKQPQTPGFFYLRPHSIYFFFLDLVEVATQNQVSGILKRESTDFVSKKYRNIFIDLKFFVIEDLEQAAYCRYEHNTN